MFNRKFYMPSIGAIGKVAACAVGLIMLLSFPISSSSSHLYQMRFGNPAVQSSIERHTFLALPEARVADSVPQCVAQPTLLNPIDDEGNIKRHDGFEFPTQIFILDLLQRLKIGPSGARSEDPFI
jgi:hypothetical protein